MIETGQQIQALLDTQRRHYQSMKQAVEKQTAYIEAMDIGGLTAGTAETRSLMRKIRDLDAELRPLRQTWHGLGLDRPLVEKRMIDGLVQEIRTLIASIQQTKDHNQGLLARSMEGLRHQMTELKARTQASRAYRQRPGAPTAARFVDRSN